MVERKRKVALALVAAIGIVIVGTNRKENIPRRRLDNMCLCSTTFSLSCNTGAHI